MDNELIRRFVKGRDEGAFAALVQRHVDLVYRAARRKVGEAYLAEDVVQAVFTALAWKAEELVGHQTIVGWLHTTTRYTASEVLRAERRRRAREQEAFAQTTILTTTMKTPPASDEAATEVAWNAMRPVIDEALGELNERDREAVLLRFFAQRSFGEIGAVLAVSENTARMRVERALDKLHGLLARRGVTSTAAALATVLAGPAVGVAAPSALAATVTGAALASTAAGVASVAVGVGAASGSVGTSAAAGSGVATAVTIFMGASKLQIAVGVAALLVLGAAFYQGAQARRLEAEGAALGANTAALVKRNEGLAAELSAAQSERAALQQKAAVAVVAKQVTAAAPAVSSNSQMEVIRDRFLERRTIARANPEYQRLQARIRALEAARTYAPLLRQLKLSEESGRRFAELIGEHEQAGEDIDAAAETQRMEMWDPALGRLREAEQAAFMAKVGELLGAEGYAAYQHYEAAADLRTSITNSITSAMYATDTPLNAAQAEALTQVLVKNTPVQKNGTQNRGDLDWDGALRDAAGLLAPPQLAALQAMRAQSRWSVVLGTALGPLVGAQPPAKPTRG